MECKGSLNFMGSIKAKEATKKLETLIEYIPKKLINVVMVKYSKFKN